MLHDLLDLFMNKEIRNWTDVVWHSFPVNGYPALGLISPKLLFMNKLSLMQWPGSRGRTKASVVGVTFPAKAYPALDLYALESLFMNKLFRSDACSCNESPGIDGSHSLGVFFLRGSYKFLQINLTADVTLAKAFHTVCDFKCRQVC